MLVELLIAPPASGKTETCIERIKSVRSTQPLVKIWVLVPDRLKAAYFRQRLAVSGGGMGVTIGTFRDLYIEILERNGIFIPVITPALEHRLVQETVDKVFENHELTHYGPIKGKPGFILALQDAFAELRGSLVRPEHFIKYTRNSTPARLELAILYDRFLSRLQELNWTDQEGQSWLAVSLLESNLKAAAEIRIIVADGFTSFTGARRQFLKLLSDQVGEMLITLPGQLDSSRQVHRRFQAVYETLQEDLSPQVTKLTTSTKLPPEILHLEKNVFDSGTELFEASRPILIEVRSQSDEVREALRWIKELKQASRACLELVCCLYQ